MQLAGYYNRQNEFDKTIDALTQRASVEPNNPEAFFTISTYYWDNAQRNFRSEGGEEAQQAGKGLEAVNKALADQARLHGGSGLQGPAAARAGDSREGPGQAAGAAQGSRRPEGSGRSAQEEEELAGV